MTELAQALQFLEAFPEADAWKVCILTRDKQPVLSGPRSLIGGLHSGETMLQCSVLTQIMLKQPQNTKSNLS